LDIVHLKQRLQAALGAGRIPVAVIPIVGTTEEGAVDPVHKVLDLRRELENEQDVSFWVHVDAAWGGYIRSIFHLTEEDEARAAVARLPGEIALGKGEDLRTWTLRFLQHVRGQAIHSLGPGAQEPTAGHELPDGDGAGAEDAITSRFKSVEKRLLHLIETDALREYLAEVSKLASKYITPVSRAPVEHLTLQDRVDLVSEYVSDTIRLEEGRYARDLQIRWGSLEVCKALLAMSQADSATVDPHKMGYVNYPCGLVAFANDRVRHFVLQKAPYITSVRQDVLVHMPPKHIAGLDSAPKEEVEAFAPFILEGSRPGAAATALWLTVKTIPPTMRGSGALVRASLIAARELYEWLVHWSAAQQHNRVDVDYQFVPLTVEPPDTNVVVFAIKKATSNSLVRMNQLTGMVYQRFTIQAELGEREYSYSQPFFLSKTTFERPRYAFSSLQPILERHFRKSYMDKISSDYQQVGLTVLRATVMNPYICLLSRHTDQHILHEFISELARAASESVRSLD
jgi:hypothetical protein